MLQKDLRFIKPDRDFVCFSAKAKMRERHVNLEFLFTEFLAYFYNKKEEIAHLIIKKEISRKRNVPLSLFLSKI